MARKKKEMPELNGAGMSDISFLLLCFFLMTSSMDQSMGIHRRLPQIPPDTPRKEDEIKIKPHNVLQVLVDGQDRVSVNQRIIDVKELKAITKDFIQNPNKDPRKSSKKKENIPGAGEVDVTEAVISLQNVRGTSYNKYLEVQNELTAAYNELRNEESQARFQCKFSELSDSRREIISSIYKQRISESPPKDTRKKK